MSTESKTAPLLKVPFEQRRAAAAQFERANQVITRGGDLEYAIQLLRDCCKLDPVSLAYRQNLRQAEKNHYKNNLKGEKLAFLKTLMKRVKLGYALRRDRLVQALDLAEEILTRNPWDTGAQIGLARAFEGLNLVDLALWTLTEARQANPRNHKVNRPLARLLEKRGNFKEAIALWDLVRKVCPHDIEAQHKVKDLAASDTIQRGKYQEVIDGTAKSAGGYFHQALDEKKEGSKEHPKLDDAPAQETSGPTVTQERLSAEVAKLQAKIEANPQIANPYLQLASLFRRYDQLDKAKGVLEQGLGPTGRNFDIAMELADLEIESFRQNLALTEEKLRAKPSDEDLKKIRTQLTKEINARELDFYRQKSDRFPTEPGHRYEMAVRLLKANQVEEAIKELQAVRTDPRHHGKAMYYLGFCFKTRNNWRLAQRNWEEALQHMTAGDESMRKEILFQLAQGCADAGDLNRAVELGCELANLDFTYKNIGTLIETWQGRLQKK